MAQRKIKALLLDLDDTLLINDMEVFSEYYFEALVAKVKPVCPAGLFIEALNVAMRAMWHNDGHNGTNAEVFEAEFFPRVGQRHAELVPLFDEFYSRDFEALREYTAVDPNARVLVELAFERGYQVAIATQPMFPLVANHARLRWAGVGADEFDYDHISSYETMCACKPHPHFFIALVDRLGRAPDECLMVGDSPGTDMAAGKLGVRTFWVNRRLMVESSEVSCDAQGTLGDLITLIETGKIHEL